MLREKASGPDDCVRISVVLCHEANVESWVNLRQALWPQVSIAEHREEIADCLRRASEAVALLAFDAQTAVGFAEVSLRRDYVNGCDSSPVAFLEGIYVKPEYRRQGVARLLNQSAEEWARRQGTREYASDADLENTASHALHLALGFEETERVVFFRKEL